MARVNNFFYVKNKLILGDCRNSIFSLFLPFLAKKFVPDSRFSDARFFHGQLLTFCEKSGTVGRRPTVPDLAPPPDFFCV